MDGGRVSNLTRDDRPDHDHADLEQDLVAVPEWPDDQRLGRAEPVPFHPNPRRFAAVLLRGAAQPEPDDLPWRLFGPDEQIRAFGGDDLHGPHLGPVAPAGTRPARMVSRHEWAGS